ncbi:MAG: hypothetical protein ACTHN5_02935 [Phycisphaerae bacterium]
MIRRVGLFRERALLDVGVTGIQRQPMKYLSHRTAAFRGHRSSLGFSYVIAGGAALAIVAGFASAQAVKQGDPARRLPKIGIYTFDGAENFPVEPGQKIYTDSGATLTAVAPELIGENGVQFPKGGKPKIGSSADIQLLIGFFRSNDAGYAKPPADARPTIQNAVAIANMPPVDVYLIPFKRCNVKRGVVFPLSGTYVFLGAIPKDMTLKPWDARQGGGDAKEGGGKQ